MRVTKNVTVTKSEYKCTSIKCDWCNKEMLHDSGTTEGGILSIMLGYGSRYDSEYDLEALDICDDCFKREIVPKLKTPK